MLNFYRGTEMKPKVVKVIHSDMQIDRMPPER
jgi:hypothetical protein